MSSLLQWSPYKFMVKTLKHRRDAVLYIRPCVSLIALLTVVLSSRYPVSQLLKAKGCFGGRVLVGFQKDWNIKSCGVYNHGRLLFSNLTRLEDFMLYFIVQHKKNTSGTEMSFIPLPMYLMLYSLRHNLFAKGLFNHCLIISKWEKMLGFIQRKGGAFQSLVFNLG